MRIGLVSYRCKNRDVSFNISQIEKAMINCAGKADVLCFGEAFLQGFDCLCWDYKVDRSTAVELSSEVFAELRDLTVR
ncbi:MAG: carbon-nitrogen hydrolase family protein, partial [Clostridia bacterium]|nr:carbon-nitrogen hydrolase family protein [Clostridia bacterium]